MIDRRLDLDQINQFGVWLADVDVIHPSGARPLEREPSRIRLDDLDAKVAGAPGLFYETYVGHDYPVWKISDTLKPGDLLNDSFLCPFTSEHHWQLIEILSIATVKEHLELLTLLSKIEFDWDIFTLSCSSNAPLGEHQANLADISKFAKELGRLLRGEPLKWDLLEHPLELKRDRKKRRAKDLPSIEIFLDALSAIEVRASCLAKSKETLQELRFSGIPIRATTKSPKRQYIWEPVFEFWLNTGRRLGYSHKGPIVRVLSVIHNALEIEAPKPASVRQAMIDFNKGPRQR